MRRARAWAAIAAIVLLAGCASRPAPTDDAVQVIAMLGNFERLAALKPDEQRREFNAAQAAYDTTPNDATRLSLALALLLPRAPWRDETRAIALLGAIEPGSSDTNSSRRDLAQFISRLLLEHDREEREEQKVQRDEQRKLDQALRQLREEKRRSEEMQQKIESLRTIDRDMRKSRKEP